MISTVTEAQSLVPAAAREVIAPGNVRTWKREHEKQVPLFFIAVSDSIVNYWILRNSMFNSMSGYTLPTILARTNNDILSVLILSKPCELRSTAGYGVNRCTPYLRAYPWDTREGKIGITRVIPNLCRALANEPQLPGLLHERDEVIGTG